MVAQTYGATQRTSQPRRRLPRRMLLASLVAGGVLMAGSLAAVASGTLSYTIEYGDTLSALADRFDTDVDTLAELNGLDNPDLIVTGEQLLIPSSAAETGAVETGAEPAGSGAVASASTLSYTIQDGDTLTSIAEHFGVSVEELAALNGIANVDLIVTGDELVVEEGSAQWAGGEDEAAEEGSAEEESSEGGEEAVEGETATDEETEGDEAEDASEATEGEGAEAAGDETATDETAETSEDGEATEAEAETAESTAAGAVIEPLDYELHLVVPNETLASIAEQYGVAEAQLTAANWHARNGLTLGMILKVPPTDASGVRMLGVPSAQEQWPVASEIAAAALATTYWGTAVSVDELLALIPASENPHEGFRGDYTGMWGSTDNYGVYAGPLATALGEVGFAAEAFYADGDAAALTSRIDAGTPVVAWVTFQLNAQERNVVENDSGRYSLIAEQHAVLVYGYDDQGVLVVDVSDGLYHRLSWDAFMASWNLFDGMGLAISPLAE